VAARGSSALFGAVPTPRLPRAEAFRRLRPFRVSGARPGAHLGTRPADVYTQDAGVAEIPGSQVVRV
jgi:hypothetical protein